MNILTLKSHPSCCTQVKCICWFNYRCCIKDISINYIYIKFITYYYMGLIQNDINKYIFTIYLNILRKSITDVHPNIHYPSLIDENINSLTGYMFSINPDRYVFKINGMLKYYHKIK